jgi:hypothetical protein
MKLRDSIIDALEMLINDSVQKLTYEQKKGKIRAWHLGLRNVSDSNIYHGLEKALSNNNGFLLSCGQFRELCITEKGVTSTDTEALEAWDLVIRNLNYYASPIFYNAIIAESIRKMGGWKKLCSMLQSEEPFRKREFIELYVALKRRNQEYQCKLDGIDKNYIKLIGFENITESEKFKILQKSKNYESAETRMLNMIKSKGVCK